MPRSTPRRSPPSRARARSDLRRASVLTGQLLGIAPAALALAIGAALVAAFVRGLAGFGMEILLVPLLGLIVPPQQAVVVSNMLGLLIGLVGLRGVWGEADRRAVGGIGALAMLATPAGLLLLAATPPAVARLVIALVAVAAFVLVLLPPHPDGHRPHAAEAGATGLAAGLLTGFAGMPGPPVVPYFMRQAIPSRTARASMLLVFALTSLASTAAAFALRLAHPRQVLFALALFAPVVAGNWLGGLAFGRVSERAWRWLVALLLAASGSAALVRLLGQ